MRARRAARAVVVMLAMGIQGCTLTHRCRVPDPVVEPEPGAQPIPLAVSVRLSPSGPSAVVTRQLDRYHRWVADVGPPTLALFEHLAARMFARVVPPPADAAEDGERPDALLEVELRSVGFDFGHLGPYRSTVAYGVTLRDESGADISTLEIEGRAERAAALELASHCKGIGDGLALAMQDAGAAFLARFPAQPRVAAWLSDRGLVATTFAVPAPGSHPVPERVAVPAAGAAEAAAAPPASAPVRAPRHPLAPRAMGVRLGLGALLADAAHAGLEDPRAGLSILLGTELRPRRWLGVELEAGAFGRSYSSRSFQEPGGLVVQEERATVSSRHAGLGLRALYPGAIAEPWAGAKVLLLRSTLCVRASLLGFPGCAPEREELTPGVELGAGLDLVAGRHHALGFDVRRVFASARFGGIAGGAVGVGGTAVALTYAYSRP